MQLPAAQNSPNWVSRTGRQAVREPEHPQATAADSRATRPAQRPRVPDPKLPETI
jgi:hypothetical protein